MVANVREVPPSQETCIVTATAPSNSIASLLVSINEKLQNLFTTMHLPIDDLWAPLQPFLWHPEKSLAQELFGLVANPIAKSYG